MIVKFYIYLHIKPNGVPFYVGKGTGNRAYVFNRKYNPHYTRILLKHGHDNIRVLVIPCQSEQHAFQAEIDCIAKLRRAGCRLCNITEGGEGAVGYRHTPEACAAISLGNQGKTIPAYQRELIRDKLMGHPTPPETRRKISEATTGRVISETSRAKQRAALLGRPQTPESNKKRSQTLKGHSISAETKAKISASLMGRVGFKHSEETKAKMSAAKRSRHV